MADVLAFSRRIDLASMIPETGREKIPLFIRSSFRPPHSRLQHHQTISAVADLSDHHSSSSRNTRETLGTKTT